MGKELETEFEVLRSWCLGRGGIGMEKDRAGRIRLPDFKIYCKATIISMVLAQKQLYRSMEQDRMSKNKHTHLWSIHL